MKRAGIEEFGTQPFGRGTSFARPLKYILFRIHENITGLFSDTYVYIGGYLPTPRPCNPAEGRKSANDADSEENGVRGAL
jgi:hypothetical protein